MEKAKNKDVPLSQTNFYESWRTSNKSKFLLNEWVKTEPSELLLQSVWQHQRLLRSRLQTSDGQSVRVLHPGFLNKEAGPDFQNAVIQFGRNTPITGDIEIDLVPNGWNAHGHQGNPAYAKVILHVVWKDDGRGGASLPTMELKPFLDSPLEEIRSWFNSDAAHDWSTADSGECCAALSRLAPEEASELLKQAAEIRFYGKARGMEVRARQCGWEQALWEGLFRALGYKQNVWPFQGVAERLPQLLCVNDSVLNIQAKFFGVSGLLPDTLPEGAEAYLRRLWDVWWRERERYRELLLSASVWHFNGLRPANLPQRRLALAAHWLADGSFMSRLESWFTSDKSGDALVDSLLGCLQPPKDEFWSYHWSFRSARLPKVHPLLGESRLADLAVNVVLPWFWMRAHAGKNDHLKSVACRRYMSWPVAQDNVTLKLARRRLFGRESVRWIKTAAQQQGLLQVVRDCCSQSNAICSACPFPDLVRSWEVYCRSHPVRG